MRRMTIVDSPEHRMGGEIYYRESDFMHDPELHRAFKCGVKQGWREAMEEVDRGEFAERRHVGNDHISYRDRWRDEPPMMRENKWREPEDDEIEYRRRRRANGQFY